MQRIFLTLIFTAVLLVQFALSCQECTADQINKDMVTVLWDSYNSLGVDNVYRVKVLEAHCKCFSSEREVKCIAMSESSTDSANGDIIQRKAVERKHYQCEHSRGFGHALLYLSEYTCDKMFDMAFGKLCYYLLLSSKALWWLYDCRRRTIIHRWFFERGDKQQLQVQGIQWFITHWRMWWHDFAAMHLQSISGRSL